MAGLPGMGYRRRMRCVAALLAVLAGGCQSTQFSKEHQARGIAGLFAPSLTDLVNQGSASTRPTTPSEPKLSEQGEKSTLVYTAQHARPDTLKDAVSGLLNPDGTIQESASLNAVVIQDRTEVIANVLTVLKALDKPTPQLLVEARVLEVTFTDDLEYEITHALTSASSGAFFQDSAITLRVPGATPTVGQGIELAVRPWNSADVRLDNFVRLLETRGNANVLSNPNVIVAPGTEASIITGQEVPVQSQTTSGGLISTSTTFKRVGIKLRVSLLQLTHDTARMEINPEVSTVTGYTAVSAGVQNPIISLRNVSSTVSLKDGEILTIGGLLQDEKNLNTRGIPILQDIPGMGFLFQSKRDQATKTQLIFFLRVHILPESHDGAVRIHQPGTGLENFGIEPNRDDKGEVKMPPTTEPAIPDGGQP